MKLPCPQCGDRDIREFSYKGAAVGIDRPAPDAGEDAWDAFVHTRENPAGATRELWYHEFGCAAWLVVERNTVTHEVKSAKSVADVAGGRA